jgi:hypothetical protein
LLDRTRLDGPFIVRAVLLLLLPPPSICMHASSGMEEALCLDRPATRFCSTEKARDSSLNTDWNYTEKRSKRDAYHQCKKKKNNNNHVSTKQSRAEQERKKHRQSRAGEEEEAQGCAHGRRSHVLLSFVPTATNVRKQAREGPGDERHLRDTWMHALHASDHRPSAEVKDSAKPAGRAGMLPLLSSRLMTLPPPSVRPPASASCQLFTICSSGRCRSMPR